MTFVTGTSEKSFTKRTSRLLETGEGQRPWTSLGSSLEWTPKLTHEGVYGIEREREKERESECTRETSSIARNVSIVTQSDVSLFSRFRYWSDGVHSD